MRRTLLIALFGALTLGCNAIVDFDALQGGERDAGSRDADVSTDAGPETDGGSTDAGPGDAGSTDAGRDAGPSPDAGPSDAGCVSTDTVDDCGACGVRCASGSACLPDGSSHACVPADCAAVQAQRTLDGLTLDDGDYLIDPDGSGALAAFTVYCADLSTAPLEYLNVDPTRNRSQSKEHAECACDRVERSWSRLRLVIQAGPTFAVDAFDRRFTTQRGFAPDGSDFPACLTPDATCRQMYDPDLNPVGNAWLGAASCAWELPLAAGAYDLGGTGFRFPAGFDATFATLGTSGVHYYMPMNVSVTMNAAREGIDTTFSAACGSYGPAVFTGAVTTMPAPSSVLVGIEPVP